MRSRSVSLSANGRAFLFCCLECPCIPNGRAGKGKARPAAWRGRDNRVEGVNLGGNRAPARGRNRNSRPEPTPQAALAGFLGPARMAGGSTGFGKCQGWGERASARRSPALSIAQSEPGFAAGITGFLFVIPDTTATLTRSRMKSSKPRDCLRMRSPLGPNASADRLRYE